MARFLVWSAAGDTLWLAQRLQRDGHAVTLHVEHPDGHAIGRGVVPVSDHPTLTPDTIVVCDATGKGALGQALRQAGYPVLGANPLDVPLEVDRAAAARTAAAVGMALPPTRHFPTPEAAAAFLAEAASGEWFVKLSGEHVSCASTFNSPDPRALARWLRWAAPQLADAEGVTLQARVDGIEISTEGWFDGTDFVPGSFTGTIEDKRLFPGDVGPRTGCQANVVWPWPDEAPLVTATVRRFTDVLRAGGYVGPFDINAIVDPRGVPVFLEATARLGFDASQALSLLVDGDFGAVLEDVARGRLARFPLRGDAAALTLRVSTPPYPAEPPAAAPLRGLPLPPGLLDDPTFFATDVMRDRQGLPALAGFDGSVGCAGIVGTDLPAMRAALVARVAALDIPQAQYRRDPVTRTEAAWEGLAAAGLVPAGTVPARALAAAAAARASTQKSAP